MADRAHVTRFLLGHMARRPTAIVSSAILLVLDHLDIHWSALVTIGWIFLRLEWSDYVTERMIERGAALLALPPSTDRVLCRMTTARWVIAGLSLIVLSGLWQSR